ncbi:hypothetical protein [Imbroritus primus]|uniref:hypothetical protein n=1 Tax=Imbroritus primus TaxID=3058603 RepID=UPI003D161B4B
MKKILSGFSSCCGSNAPPSPTTTRSAEIGTATVCKKEDLTPHNREHFIQRGTPGCQERAQEWERRVFFFRAQEIGWDAALEEKRREVAPRRPNYYNENIHKLGLSPTAQEEWNRRAVAQEVKRQCDAMGYVPPYEN